jgi:hypothetical protein
MSQTSYSILMGAGFKGEVVDARSCNVESKVCETAAGIGFGTGVVGGADLENGVRVPTSTYSAGDVFRGVATQQHKEQSYPFTTSSGTYAQNDMVNVLRRGKIFVYGIIAVAADADVYLDPATGDFTSSSSSTIATGGKFRQTTTAAGLVEAEFNLP